MTQMHLKQIALFPPFTISNAPMLLKAKHPFGLRHRSPSAHNSRRLATTSRHLSACEPTNLWLNANPTTRQ